VLPTLCCRTSSPLRCDRSFGFDGSSACSFSQTLLAPSHCSDPFRPFKIYFRVVVSASPASVDRSRSIPRLPTTTLLSHVPLQDPLSEAICNLSFEARRSNSRFLPEPQLVFTPVGRTPESISVAFPPRYFGHLLRTDSLRLSFPYISRRDVQATEVNAVL